ncbi:MAG TPA: sigma-70 family RNA polymerase sigma factor [Gemmataceae bacterium]
MPTGPSCEVERTDEELLERFVASRDAASFEVLVRRHGPMVLGVCRRVLQHPQDAEDAFQATFLVLVRKAASLCQRELLGNWLDGVAYRTALDARAAALRRRKREKQVNAMPEPEARDDPDEWRDLRPLVDRELNRLPDKYRIPIVLCDLEGKTRQDAAEALDLPVGTLSGRLTTAREMLAKRLTRHGLALSAGALGAALSPSAAPAAVPAPLVTSTVQAATAGVISSQAAALASGVVKAMLVKKLKIATVVVLTALAGTAAVVVHADRLAIRAGVTKVLDLGFGERGRRVAWSPDGKTLAVVTKVEKAIFGIQFDRRGSAIRLWDVEKGRMKQALAESTEKGLSFQDALFSADGKTIAAIVDGFQEVVRPNGDRELQLRWVVKIWDANTLALKHTLESEHSLFALALSPDGKRVAAGSHQLIPPGNRSKKWIKLWNAQTGKLERTLEFAEAEPGPISFAFSPDSKTFVLGCQKDVDAGQVQWWDAQTWKRTRAYKLDKYVHAVVFSANGKVLASASGHDSIQLWDAQKGEPIRSLKGAQSGRSLALSPDGQTVAASGKDGNIRLWDVQTGVLKETRKGHSEAIYSLAFSPDGKTLASTGQDETVRIWPINQRAAEDK